MTNTLDGVLPPAAPGARAEALLAFTSDPAEITRFDIQLDALLLRLAQLGDAQLLQLAAHAARLEACAFRLRGACVAEMRRRVATRLAGGRGKRDTDGAGVRSRLSRLAAQIGVGVSTLKTDARIHEIFFAGETGLAREPTLPREYYVIALGAPNPLTAIRTARERSSDANYKREQFRRDVRALKEVARPAGAPAPAGTAPEAGGDVRVTIRPDARRALAELTGRSGQSPETVVAEALLAYLKSPAAVQVNSSPAHTTPSPKNRRGAAATVPRQEQPLLPLLL